jgi:hypothetical protein
MKYLFIFLPFFAFGQDTIAFPDGDTIIHGQLTYGGNSALYGVRIDSAYVADHSTSFTWHRPGEEFPDTCWLVMGNIRVLKPGCSETPRIESWAATWISCDQHIGKSESYQREKTDTSEVKLLVWTGCSLSEISATKYLFYNEMQVAKNTGGLAVYITETIKVDVIDRYVSDGKWIKPSHVIKEL